MPLPLLAIPAGLMGVITVIQVIFTAVSLVITLLSVLAGFDNVLSFATGISGPAKQIVGYMYDLITGFLPFSLDSLFNTLDTALSTSSPNNPFTPALTFSGFMNTIAFKETFNTVMMAMIEGLTFVVSVRFLRWSIGNLRVRWKS